MPDGEYVCECPLDGALRWRPCTVHPEGRCLGRRGPWVYGTPGSTVTYTKGPLGNVPVRSTWKGGVLGERSLVWNPCTVHPEGWCLG